MMNDIYFVGHKLGGVLYDRYIVEVVGGVKGQHCGACGNYDGSASNELRDKHGQALGQATLAEAWCS